MKRKIEDKLRETFSPLYLEVQDESHLHIGHAYYREGGNTHFAITLVSPLFTNLSRIQRHQRIYTCLDAELKAGVHALSLKALCPEEGEDLGELE